MILNEHEMLLKISNALVSICVHECCNYGFNYEVEWAEKILESERTDNNGNNQNNGHDN